MLDVPMYFVYRDGKYIDAAGQSFRDFMAGRLPALPGETPVMEDWLDHLTTVFPEVRLKQFLEMRGADAGPARRICALPAFWVGLLYDSGALDAAWDLVKGWSRQDHEFLRTEVPKRALATPFQGRTVGDLALEVLEMAREGLRRRQYKDQAGRDETRHLDTLMEIANARRTPAEDLLEAFETRWEGSVDPVFRELAY
ncbi:MAG: glutamate-cysteine ligase family protein, partial [Alphaproteobacteria bacterium]